MTFCFENLKIAGLLKPALETEVRIYLYGKKIEGLDLTQCRVRSVTKDFYVTEQQAAISLCLDYYSGSYCIIVMMYILGHFSYS